MTRTEDIAIIDDVGILLAEAEGIAGLAAAYAESLTNAGTNLGVTLHGVSHLVRLARERLRDL